MEIKPCRKVIIYILFAVSGFCALVYEILWTKYLSLTFGTTILAVSTVAATFMGGLALGSYLLGRYADRETNLLRIYAFLELGIALSALLFPPTLELIESAYVYLSQTFPANKAASASFHFIFSAVLLLPPAACMGGTFPLMCRFFARKRCGAQIGRLYALNTLGATLGVFGAGFFLIPSLGLSTTGYLAVFINLTIAATSFLLASQIGDSSPRDVSATKRPGQPLQASKHRLVLVAIGVIGFLSLAYEILWTRVLLLFLGNTTYAFALMLSAYLVGIAIGGALYARMVRPGFDERRVFATLCTLMAFSVLATAPFYDSLAHLFQFAHEASGERWWHLSMLSFIIVFLIMSIPTALSGALLPAAVAILDPGKIHTGEGVGLVVLHNTSGAVLGSLAAGFLLIPAVGILDSFRLLICLNLLLALALCLYFHPFHRPHFAVPALAGCGLVLALLPFSWNQELMNSGVYIYAPKYTRMGGIERILEAERLMEVIEGIDTTVAVHESLDGQFRFFTVNGKTDGGTGRDMSTQTLVGHLPLLLHPDPQDVLVIGLGTGITLNGMDEYPTRRIDCAEISPGVVKAADHFSEANGRALDSPKVRLFVRDGRNLLLTRPERYDVIVSEPSNPWQTGNANLFTADFYRLAAERMKPSGLFCQWIGLYDITPENLKVACNTFLEVFPRAMVFKAGTDLIMVGARHELTFDYQGLRQRMAVPGIRAILEEIDIDSPGALVAGHYLFSESTLSKFSEGAELNTDDRPILEYSARHNLGERTMGEFQQQNMKNLLATQGAVYLPFTNLGGSRGQVAAALRDLGKGYAKVGRNAEAEHFMRKAAEVEQASADVASPGPSRERG